MNGRPRIGSSSTIRESWDFHRIYSLPRRVWTPQQMEQCAAFYTAKLRTYNGTMHLKPIQAVALHEIGQFGGLLGPIRVGGGKTLISLLAPRMVNAIRPILLLPAALIDKTRRELGQLMQHWNIPRNIEIKSYEILSRESEAQFLELARPDLIIGDEVHRLKNRKAGVTRRVERYMNHAPNTKFVAISGTLMRDDLEDWAHIAKWSLKDNCPVPIDRGELMEWNECLGKQENPFRHVDPGALLSFASVDDVEPSNDIATARKGFRRRLKETPGVVASVDEHVACSLSLTALEYPVNEQTEGNFTVLRTAWETPDGWALSQAVDVWRHARELALGLHYIWDPRPPQEWLDRRREWAKFVRGVLSHSRSIDTELQVVHACQDGTLPSNFLVPWLEIEPTYKGLSKPIWHDDSALKACEKWMKKAPGIVWVEHAFFGHELAKRTGIDYYGEQGLNARGQQIMDADPKKSLIASGRANSTGRNLQAWNRNLVTAPMASALSWEQLLGRTHRDGQLADEVTCDFFFACIEHWSAVDRSIEGARMNRDLMGESQKLLLADIMIPSIEEKKREPGNRWIK